MQCNWWCAACGGQCDWRNPNRILVMQDSTDRREATVFGVHAAPDGVCENLVNALRLLASQHQDGEVKYNFIKTTFIKKNSSKSNSVKNQFPLHEF